MTEIPIARRIRASGYTFTEMAKMLGISPASLSKRLTGKTKFTAFEAVKIGKILNLSADQLYECFTAKEANTL